MHEDIASRPTAFLLVDDVFDPHGRGYAASFREDDAFVQRYDLMERALSWDAKLVRLTLVLGPTDVERHYALFTATTHLRQGAWLVDELRGAMDGLVSERVECAEQPYEYQPPHDPYRGGRHDEDCGYGGFEDESEEDLETEWREIDRGKATLLTIYGELDEREESLTWAIDERKALYPRPVAPADGTSPRAARVHQRRTT